MRELQSKQEKRPMNDEFLRLLETTKALITYIDVEYVLIKLLMRDVVVLILIDRTNL